MDIIKFDPAYIPIINVLQNHFLHPTLTLTDPEVLENMSNNIGKTLIYTELLATVYKKNQEMEKRKPLSALLFPRSLSLLLRPGLDAEERSLDGEKVTIFEMKTHRQTTVAEGYLNVMPPSTKIRSTSRIRV
ncbi:hypothetical protein L6452_43419 [Arctium lappa]|uniref:Uncharacterized protein n=1 Tax=Arctium lappa TaxID=4217 RepID=A0ACB8XE17_ARCLA|nr:hypothetical protein L6452_43419 [Arctium lappa]